MKLPESVRNCLPLKRRAPLVKPHGPSNEGNSLTSKRRSPSMLDATFEQLESHKWQHSLCAVSDGSSMIWILQDSLMEPITLEGYHTVFLSVNETPTLKHLPWYCVRLKFR